MKLPLTLLAGLVLAATAGAQGRPGTTSQTPLLKALDQDGDGQLSATEIDEAARALLYLDEDGDGTLAGPEWSTASGKRSRRGSGWDWGGMDDMGGMGMGRGRNVDSSQATLPADLAPEDGTGTLVDRAMFEEMSQLGERILAKRGVRYLKFQIEDQETGAPRVYFINTKKHAAHSMFMNSIGGGSGYGGMRGALIFHPFLRAPSGGAGLYTFEFEMQDAHPHALVLRAHELLEANSPLLRGRLAYHPLERDLERYEEERALYDTGTPPVFLSEDLYADIGFLPLHVASSFGRLRLMGPGERPGPRDVAVYETLPNEMPRVAGVITAVRQTPLSHVNLRAIQDDVPNAFVTGAVEAVAPLLGKYVRYAVTGDGYELREATLAEVNEHFDALRPSEPRVPPRDLSVTDVRPLDRIAFGDSASFGVKTANLATLRTLDLPDGLVPDGFGVPFHFYDAFMEQNGLYAAVAEMRAAPGFAADTDERIAALAKLRKRIERAPLPAWMERALDELHRSFPKGTALRCRSSTNNEDLPGFSGAGLYDSFTHRPREGHLSKSVKQVYASLWNFRAYEEREFHRIDHMRTAMGVLVHPRFARERANGVAVTEDVLYRTAAQRGRSYLVNAQVGEDMVTNPGGDSIPEELLLSPRFPRDDTLLRRSNRVADDARVLGPEHLGPLRVHLKTIHREFHALYDAPADAPFAMEVEFKVTEAGRLSIKQARPWVF
jgi:hypothetical protein